MFVEEELLKITVYYKKSGRHYVVYSSDVFNDIGLKQEEKDKFKSLTVKAKQLNWGLYNALQEAAMVSDNLGNRKWNYKVYKENKLRSIIVKWDATTTNDKGEVINAPLTPQTFANLSPDIAEAILNAYDQMTLVDEQDEKKS